jgi:hypothetical protein
MLTHKEVIMSRARWAIGLALLVGLFTLVAGCFLLSRPPAASFVVVYNVTQDPLVVDLDASSSSDPDGDAIAAYMWTFGEDVQILTPLEFTKLVTVPVLRVRYPIEGDFTVQLFVRDERGLTSETGQTETIHLPNIAAEPAP